MLHTDAKSLKERGELLFARKRPWDSRNQDIADNFYCARADFTVVRDIGDRYADHQMTGYPEITRRSLGDSIGTMLRPKDRQWFHMSAGYEDDEATHEAKAWLEWATTLQRRAMYDRVAGLARATKEADHDFASFGGAAISTEMNRRDNALLYRCWHLRDVAWAEDFTGQVGEVYRKWKPTLRELCGMSGLDIHPKLRERKEKEPGAKADALHCVLRADDYDWKKSRHPYVSLWIDCENHHVMEERGSWTRIYSVPRWATVSGSAYPYSPAAIVALPDARLLQAMTLTLLDAGERAANPPMIGVAEAIRGDLQQFPGGFTAVDAEYDERLGEVLRPLTVDKSGLPFGMEMSDRISEVLREAFFLNTISMPPAGGPDMTAYEVGQRVQEYIRNALPIFEPMEQDYNGELCDITFETLLREGAFGPPDQIPEDLQGEDISFKFESPLSEMIERQKGQKFLEAKAMIAEAVPFDESAARIMDFGKTLRDVLSGIGAPTKWLNSPEAVEAEAEAARQAQQAAQLLQGMEQSANIASTLGDAAERFDVGAA